MVRIAIPFDASRARILDEGERARVGGFLLGGDVLMYTTGSELDKLEPERGRVVGLVVRTDGEWVWSQAVHYYLTTYGLAPEPDLYHHIQASGYVSRPTDASIRDRVLRELRAPRQPTIRE